MMKIFYNGHLLRINGLWHPYLHQLLLQNVLFHVVLNPRTFLSVCVGLMVMDALFVSVVKLVKLDLSAINE